MNKLKIFGLIASLAGFAVSLVANAIDDKKMEEAVNEAVDKRLGVQSSNDDPVSEKESSDPDYSW